MLDKQTVFGAFVGLAVLALGLFSLLQGAAGWSLMVVGLMILAVTMLNCRLRSKQDSASFIAVERTVTRRYRYQSK